MFVERMEKNRVNCWLINIGWIGGKFGIGKCCLFKYMWVIVDVIYNGFFVEVEYENFFIFNFVIFKVVEGVFSEILNFEKVWLSKEVFKVELDKLGGMF